MSSKPNPVFDALNKEADVAAERIRVVLERLNRKLDDSETIEDLSPSKGPAKKNGNGHANGHHRHND